VSRVLAGIVVATVGCVTRGDFPDVAAPADAETDSGTPPWRDVQPIAVDVPPRDAQLAPDAACAVATAMGTVERAPVDIIWVVDNSVSMRPAIDQVTAGLNAFAATVGTRGLDYRVVMLSLRSATNPVTISGGMRYGVCIPRPLAGDDACGNGPRFFHVSADIRSTQPLDQLLGTLGQTAGYRLGEDRGGEPWRGFLRPTATKTIVIVTDDNSRLSPTDFERFAGGPNPNNASLTLPPGLLDASWSGLFDGYTFDGLYGWGSATDPAVRCRFPDGTGPASSGLAYTTLVARTSGVRAQLCDGAAAWTPFFDSVASAVERTSRIACDLAIPSPSPGFVLDPALVNVLLTGTTNELVGRVAGMGACGATGGWYYDRETSPQRIFLCPASCTRAQTRAREPGGGGVQVQFGCQSIPG
jgi:hypothetical protein